MLSITGTAGSGFACDVFVTPKQPEQSEQREQREQSEQSEQSEQPEQPGQPEQHEQPGQSQQPEQPRQPEQPEQSEQSEQPEQPEQSEQPEQFLRLSSARWASSLVPQYSTEHLLPFWSLIHVVIVISPWPAEPRHGQGPDRRSMRNDFR